MKLLPFYLCLALFLFLASCQEESMEIPYKSEDVVESRSSITDNLENLIDDFIAYIDYENTEHDGLIYNIYDSESSLESLLLQNILNENIVRNYFNRNR